MKKLLAFFAAACAAGMLGAAPARMASEAWVLRQIAKAGIRAPAATVVTNADKSVTFSASSAYVPGAYSDATNITRISVSFRVGVVPPASNSTHRVARRTRAAAARSGADLDENGHLTVWLDRVVWEHTRFTTADGETYVREYKGGTIGTDLAEMPNPSHECDDECACYCSGHQWESVEDVELPADLAEMYGDRSRADMDALGNWFDVGAWEGNGAGYVKKTPKGTYHYMECTLGEDGDVDPLLSAITPSWEELQESEAWSEAMDEALVFVNFWQERCRKNCRKALFCDKHDFEGGACAMLNEYEHRAFCVCKEQSRIEAHEKDASGEKEYVYGKDGHITGWITRGVYCVRNCGWSRSGVNHVCRHVDCSPCSGGDGCVLPCQTCDGKHQIAQATKTECLHCECDNCNVTEYTLYGERTRENHADWHDCGHLADAQSTRSGGDHCCCACGDWSHENATPHAKKSKTPYREKIAPSDAEWPEHANFHWVANETACEYCGDRSGDLEAHDMSEGGASVSCSFKDENSHAKMTACGKNCGYKKESDSEPHVRSGEALAWENASAEACRGYFMCDAEKGCGHIFWKDEEHVRSTDPEDKCRCAQCKDFQFPHDYGTDACGNRVCTACQTADPAKPETHKGAVNNGDVHACACGRESEAHIWGTMYIKSEAAGAIVLEMTCVASSWGGGGCGAKLEKTVSGLPATCDPENGIHVPDPLGVRCGCDCGEYDATAPADDFKLHLWPDGDCRCLCRAMHKPKTGGACPKVCAACQTHAATEGTLLDAYVFEDAVPVVVKITQANAAEYHESFEPAKATHCGCRCGAVTPATDIPAFHYKMPNSCRCYGDGTGGKWHFRLPEAGCENVCRIKVDGESHRAAQADAEETATLVPATEDDHTAIGRDGLVCGCKCGEWGENGKPISSTSPLHAWGDHSCVCRCGARTTRPASDPAELHGYSAQDCLCDCKTMHKTPGGSAYCPNVCAGKCNYVYKAQTGVAAGLKATESDHTKTLFDECGCKCGKITAPAPESPLHNHASGKCLCWCGKTKNPEPGRHEYLANACVCVCGVYHKGAQQSGCTRICATCKRLVTDTLASAPDADKTSHTRAANACGCACGEFGAGDYPPDMFWGFHAGRYPEVGKECLCSCGAAHVGFDPSECPQACRVCGWNANLTKDGKTIHTFDEGSCSCRCGRCKEHGFDDDKCVCWCKETSRLHRMEEVSRTLKSETTCQICHGTIRTYHVTDKCERCGYKTERDESTPHGAHNTHPPQACYGDCPCTSCGCDACYYGYGTCVTCGEVCGEESGGTTDDPPGKIPAGHENLSAADVAALLTSWNGKDLKVLDGDDPVYNIEPNAFRNTFGTKNDIRALNFNFVTNVGDAAFKDAFAGCTNLQSVSFTNLRVVSSAAFENAFKGARVDLRLPKLAGTAMTASFDDETKGCGFAGAGIRRFQADVFGGSGGGLLMGCTGLEEAVFPKLGTVGHYMFYGCTSLTNVVIPKAALVQREAFAYCTSLKTLDFPGKTIGDYALHGSGIVTINAPNLSEPSPGIVFNWYHGGGGGPSRVTVNYANGSTVYDPNVSTNIAQTATGQ